MVTRRGLLRAGITGAALAGGAALTGAPMLASASAPSCSWSHAYFNRNIPGEAHTKIGEYVGGYLADVSFAPNGGWVVVAGDGRYFARNIPDECFTRLGSFISSGDRTQCVAFPPWRTDAWVIVTETRLFARNIPDACYRALLASLDAGDEIYCVAFTGTSGWCILTDRGPQASGIPSEAWTQLTGFDSGGRPPEHIAFTPSGGWVVLARDAFFARNIPDEAYSKMLEYHRDGRRVTHVAFTPSGGWHVSSNDRLAARAPSGGLAAVRTVMTRNNIPGMAVAAVRPDGSIVEHYYGSVERGGCHLVNSETRFQVASVSKTLAAAGALRMIELGLVSSLTEDIYPRLGVTIPSDTQICFNWGGRPICWPTSPVLTLNQLLSHTNGVKMIQGGSHSGGFAGYRRGTTIPSTTDVIAGRGNSGAFSISASQIGSWEYSGAGFVLVQRLTEVLGGSSYDTWMRANLLNLIGMWDSSFTHDPRLPEDEIAVGHDAAGYSIGRRRHVYPEGAAAGLYTSARDLLGFVMAINRGGTDMWGRRLWSTALQTSLLTRVTGNQALGFQRGSDGASRQSFSHGGVNAGFRAFLWGSTVSRTGVVVLANHADPAGTQLVQDVKDIYLAQYGL